MSRIDDLIKRLAPRGVEYRMLGDVAEVFRGKRFVKADIVGSGVPCIHYGEIYTKYGLSASVSYSFLEPNRARNLRVALPGDLVVAVAGETIEDIGNAVAWLGSEPVVIHDACYTVRSAVLDATFLSYLFRTRKFKDQIRKWISSSKISSISTQNLSRALVPVPPLGVQREIVRILDTFTDLEAELGAELEARRQQYAHYRDTLLSFEGRGDIEWKALKAVGSFHRGRRFTKADLADEGIPCIHYGEIYTHYGTSATTAVSSLRSDLTIALRFAEPGDVIVVDVGETVEDVGKAVAWLGDEPVAIHDHSYAYRSELDPSYVSYLMQTAAFVAERGRFVARTKVKTLLIDGFGTVRVPVPSIEEQRRIVGILNKFDALVNDLSSGLPAEVEARRQQYVYYRDRLLTFEEAAA
ncbi:MAG TPA: restriction endonuclease subunit S [Lacisediminihabitans sp.]|uniref:restriction endonuclease subunit S n=1 Tax=Lacisediminihabitans sp. TaxID=2787631 RepID=UPI002ED79A0C